MWTYKWSETGVVCNAEGFGTYKHDVFADWTFICQKFNPMVACAGEGEKCKFEGTRTVMYGSIWGANPGLTWKTAANGVECTNEVFGDPAPGNAKLCWYPKDAWLWCANEGDNAYCTVPEPTLVMYGSDIRWAYQYVIVIRLRGPINDGSLPWPI
jgi:hypothetical protein